MMSHGSGNGLVPSGNKPLPEPVFDQDRQRHMASLGPNEYHTVQGVIYWGMD